MTIEKWTGTIAATQKRYKKRTATAMATVPIIAVCVMTLFANLEIALQLTLSTAIRIR